MPIAKVRNLSKYGVVTDTDAYNLPLEAWSMAVNARFKQGCVERGPVFRRAPLELAESDPRFLATSIPTSGFDTFFIGYLNGMVSAVSGLIESDVSIFGYVANPTDVPYTHCHLANVEYVNREDRVPWSKTSSDTLFQALPNWDATWRARILRSCNSSLVAFGITKGSTEYPTMVKSSSPAVFDTEPASWDETDPAVNAYENIIGEMEGKITEAQTLGDVMIVYGPNETWKMTPTATSDIWDVRRIFNDAGCIGVNCAVEVDKRHYVFGLNDIWVHDGVSKKSIINDRIKRRVFENLSLADTQRCFVTYDELRKEVRFNYVSADELCAFQGVDGCNRAAVYYIPEDSWTFDDTPFVFSASRGNIDTTETWTSIAPATWEDVGGTWLAQETSLKRPMLMVGNDAAGYDIEESLYVFDEAGPGSLTTLPVDANATAGFVLYRDGIDLDDMPDSEQYETYKVLDKVFLQVRFDVDTEPLDVSIGVADGYNDTPTFTAAMEFDPNEHYRCDFGIGGRYVFIRITHDDVRWFRITGYDLDVYTLGDR
jgi:hypothetical protein